MDAATATLEKPMGRKRSETPRDDTSVKVDRKIVEKARLVAVRRGVTLAEFLSSLLSAPVEAEYDAEVDALTRGAKGPKPKR